jgi:hypothetical protein
MATPSIGYDNKFSTTLSSGISASDTTIPLTNLPTATEGYLVIEPDSSTNYEIIYYTSKTGSAVICPSVAAGRGQGGSTAASHSSGAVVRCDTVAEYFETLQDGSALAAGAITPNKLVSDTGTTWTWQSWTPTWTNFNIGNGTVVARYRQIGKNVRFNIRVIFGSTTSIGTAPTFTLPVAASGATYDITRNNIIGKSWAEDFGVISFAGVVGLQGSLTAAAPFAYNQSISSIYITHSNYTASVPFSFGDNDYFVCEGEYEAA